MTRTRHAWRAAAAITLAALAPWVSFAGAEPSGAPLADVPRMVEEASAAGIDHVYAGGWEHFVGGGVAAFDCSGDRRPDLVIAGGANPTRLFVNRSRAGGPMRFEEEGLGLSERDLARVTGAYALDIDSDGVRDLILTRVGANVALRGLGGCRFEKANRRWSIDGGRAWSTGLAATWEIGKALPTLAIANYVDRAAPGSPWGTCHDNTLLRPEGGGYREPVALRPGHCALSILFTDWNRSGDRRSWRSPTSAGSRPPPTSRPARCSTRGRPQFPSAGWPARSGTRRGRAERCSPPRG